MPLRECMVVVTHLYPRIQAPSGGILYRLLINYREYRGREGPTLKCHLAHTS